MACRHDTTNLARLAGLMKFYTAQALFGGVELVGSAHNWHGIHSPFIDGGLLSFLRHKVQDALLHSAERFAILGWGGLLGIVAIQLEGQAPTKSRPPKLSSHSLPLCHSGFVCV